MKRKVHDMHIRVVEDVYEQIEDEAEMERRPYLSNMIEVLLVEALQQREKKRKRRKKGSEG